MRTKLAAYYDRERDVILHGLKVFVAGTWCRLAEDGKPVLFEHEAEAENKRKEYRRMAEPRNPNIVFPAGRTALASKASGGGR